MANSEDWEDDDDQSGNEGKPESAPKGLRAHAKKLDEENKSLKARLDELEHTARKDRVTKAVAAKGFDPAVADVVPEDVASDEAALEKWLTEKGKLFAKATKPEDEMVEEGFPEETLEEDQDGYMRISRVSQGAIPASRQANVRAEIKSAKSREELDAVLRKHGNAYVE